MTQSGAHGPMARAVLGSWDCGAAGLPVQGLLGHEPPRGTNIQPPSQPVHLTWIAFSSFRKRRISSGPFSMVGMCKCWRRQRREDQEPPFSLPSPTAAHLTLPWYRIWCTGQTWQAVPEPKTSRTRPSSSARNNSFMVTLRSATRNSPCPATHVSPGAPPAAGPCLSLPEKGDRDTRGDRHPRRQTPREKGQRCASVPQPPPEPPKFWPPTQQFPIIPATPTHGALTQVLARSSRLCLTTPGRMTPSSEGVTSSSTGSSVRAGGLPHALRHTLPSS